MRCNFGNQTVMCVSMASVPRSVVIHYNANALFLQTNCSGPKT